MPAFWGQDISYKIAMPGRHLVMNSLAVLSAATLAGADLAIAALALAKMTPPPGRGAREQLAVAGGTALLVDESYNANPASMRALHSPCSVRPKSAHAVAHRGIGRYAGTRPRRP